MICYGVVINNLGANTNSRHLMITQYQLMIVPQVITPLPFPFPPHSDYKPPNPSSSSQPPWPDPLINRSDPRNPRPNLPLSNLTRFNLFPIWIVLCSDVSPFSAHMQWIPFPYLSYSWYWSASLCPSFLKWGIRGGWFF